MTSYVALIHKDKGTEYGVSFPDLPGCISAGTTIDEAIQMAREALALHLEGMIADGEVLPVPSGAEAIRANEDAADAILALVDVPDDAKVERINLTVPKLSLARFDSYAARHSFNRSNLFVHAVEKLIDQESPRKFITKRFSTKPGHVTADTIAKKAIRRPRKKKRA